MFSTSANKKKSDYVPTVSRKWVGPLMVISHVPCEKGVFARILMFKSI